MHRVSSLVLFWCLSTVAAENGEKPLGVPDYTKITGFVENADLPIEQPVYRRVCCGRDRDRPLTATPGS